MTEPTYSVFRLLSESPKQLGFSKRQLSSLNNDRMNMKWLKLKCFELNLAYNLRKHPTLGGMMLYSITVIE